MAVHRTRRNCGKIIHPFVIFLLLLQRIRIVMKKKAMWKVVLPLLVLLTACGGSNEEKTSETKETKAKIVVHFKNEAEMDARAKEIDSITTAADQIASSLRYSKDETGESIEVFGYMNSENEIMKIEEQFSDGNGKNNGKRIYYLNGGKPFLTMELIDQVSGDKAQFVDRISYYDEKGKVMKTKERRGDFQETTESMKYKPAPLFAVSIDRAMRALNQEKEFQTTFQGFIHQDVFSYLIVGENNPDGFRSTLRLDYKDKLIQLMSDNERGYMGEPIRVNFQKHTDETGFQFQVYAGGLLAEEAAELEAQKKKK